MHQKLNDNIAIISQKEIDKIIVRLLFCRRKKIYSIDYFTGTIHTYYIYYFERSIFYGK